MAQMSSGRHNLSPFMSGLWDLCYRASRFPLQGLDQTWCLLNPQVVLESDLVMLVYSNDSYMVT